MEFSPVSSTSYSRTVRPTADGRSRRERQAGQLFNLQTRSAGMEASDSHEIQPNLRQLVSQEGEQSAQEKWLRLMGAARQVAYQAGEQPLVKTTADNQRYRLQRTYFDQERQANPIQPAATDRRLMAYHDTGTEDHRARMVDFVI